MTKRISALAVFCAAALLTVAAAPANAGPFNAKDDTGDSLDTRASTDIISVTYEVKPMAPRDTPSLVVTLELAAPPEAALTSYDVHTQIEGCGYFQMTYAPGNLFQAAGIGGDTSFFMECGSPADSTGSTATLLDGSRRIDGNKFTAWIPLGGLPKELRGGGTMTELNAYTQFADPVFGIIGNGSVGLPPTDELVADMKWKF